MPNKTKQNHTTRKQKMLTTTIQITNNPPHTPPPPKHPTKRVQQKREAATCEPKRSNGVEREPDSVFASTELAPLFSTKKHPRTHTHQEKPSVNTCEHKKHTPRHTRVSLMRIPKKSGLPRKEVIQPHLPVRLPCYDFVPIANPTFDHSPQNG